MISQFWIGFALRFCDLGGGPDGLDVGRFRGASAWSLPCRKLGVRFQPLDGGMESLLSALYSRFEVTGRGQPRKQKRPSQPRLAVFGLSGVHSSDE